jgi:hypothetical protein
VSAERVDFPHRDVPFLNSMAGGTTVPPASAFREGR